MNGIALYRLPNTTSWIKIEGKLSDHYNPSLQGFLINDFKGENKFFLSAASIEHNFNLSTFDVSHLHFLPEINPVKTKDYLNALNNAIDSVNKGTIDKVVVSRNKKFDFNIDNTVQFLASLDNAFPKGFIYLFSTEKTGTWIGASPEAILTETENHLHTTALAGTIQSDQNIELEDWKEKEIQEHQFVCDYIEEILRKNDLEFTASLPYSFSTGKLFHLKKDYTIEKKNTCSIEHLANQLHPTPAVCGLPIEKAKQFILDNEKYNRLFYTGYLGPLNIENSTNLFVNLRCGQVFKNALLLYAGGGINKGSIASKEEKESLNKMENLSRFI